MRRTVLNGMGEERSPQRPPPMGASDKTKETQKQTMIPSFCDTIKASQRHSKPMEPLETIKAQIAQLKPKFQNDYHITELGI